MLRLLLILLIVPAFSFAQKGKLYVSVDGAYGTNRVHSANLSAGYTKSGFHMGVGGGVQKNQGIDYKQISMTQFPMFAEIGFRKAKLPFVTIRGGSAVKNKLSRKVEWYTNARIGMPFRVTNSLYVSPFIYTSAWKLEVKPNESYGYVPLQSTGFGLMLSRF